jgi:anti-sigma factor RsiW
MKCEECQSLIESYFDGEIQEPEARRVAGHLAICAACAQAYQKLEREQDFYLRHESDDEVSPDFWANVLTQTAQEKALRSKWNLLPLRARLAQMFGAFSALRLGPLATTAIVLLTVAMTAGVMKQLYLREKAPVPETNSQRIGSGQLPSSPAASKVDKAVQPPVVNRDVAVNSRNVARVPAAKQKPMGFRRQTADDLVHEAEQKYLAAIALLSRDANRRRSQLDAEAVAQFDQALAAVDRTIAGTRRAAHARTDDPVAVQYMLAAYAKKVDVLRQIVGDQ